MLTSKAAPTLVVWSYSCRIHFHGMAVQLELGDGAGMLPTTSIGQGREGHRQVEHVSGQAGL